MPKSLKVFSVFVASLSLFLIPSLAFGQSNSQIQEDNPIFLPEVSVEDVKLNKKEFTGGEQITGSFKMINRSKRLLDGLYYSVSIVGGFDEYGNNPKYALDTKTVFDPIVLDNGEGKVINFTYTPAAYVGGDMLAVQVRVYGSNYATLGSLESRMINISKSIEGLLVKDLSITTNNGERYNLGEGPTITKDGEAKSVYFNFSLSNPSKETIEVAPKFKIFNQFKQEVVLKEFDGEKVTINGGKASSVKKVELPVFDYAPGVYTGTVDFVDSNGQKRTQTLPLRYIVGGDIATIQAFTSNQGSANAGEVINLTLAYTGRPIDVAKTRTDKNYTLQGEPFDLNIKIFNEQDEIIATLSTSTPSFSIATMHVNVLADKDATALRGIATLSKNGKVLYEKAVVFNKGYEQIRNEAKKAYMPRLLSHWALVALLVLVLLISLILFRFGKFGKLHVVLSIIILLTLLALVFYPFFYKNSRVGAADYHLMTTQVAEDSSGSFTFYSPFASTPLDAGKYFYVQARAEIYACYNNPTGVNQTYASTTRTSTRSTSKISFDTQYDGGDSGNSGYYSFNQYPGNYLLADDTIGTRAVDIGGTVYSGQWSVTDAWRRFFNVVHYGECGVAHGTIVSDMPSYPNACSFGNQTNQVISPTGNPNSATWDCDNLGHVNHCEASLNAVCGSSNGSILNAVPVSPTLCEPNHGGVTPAVTTVSDGYTWTCIVPPNTIPHTTADMKNPQIVVPQSTASCKAFKKAQCGSANSLTPVATKPTTNLCLSTSGASAGTVTANTSTNKYEWTCTGGGVNNVANCSVPAVSTCGALGDATGDTIAKNGSVLPGSSGLCAVENSLLGPITVNYGNGVWSWACQNVAHPPADSCSAKCVANTYYCENTNTCSDTCSDWCPASADGNPAGNQRSRKSSFLNIDANGKCSIAQIDKFFLRPSIADSANKCVAYWSIKATSTDRTVTCRLDDNRDVTSMCKTTLSTGIQVDAGEHTFEVTVGVDDSTPPDGIIDYTLVDAEKVKCTPNPNFKQF